MRNVNFTKLSIWLSTSETTTIRWGQECYFVCKLKSHRLVSWRDVKPKKQVTRTYSNKVKMKGKKWRQREDDYDQNSRKCLKQVQHTTLQWNNRDRFCMWALKCFRRISFKTEGSWWISLPYSCSFGLSIMYRVSGIFLILNHFFSH